MSESNEKKEGSCCKSGSSCCGCKKFLIGILVGVLIAVIGHCFVCGKGSLCGKSKMCPIGQTMQVPAQ